jgi:hypothetical protein
VKYAETALAIVIVLAAVAGVPKRWNENMGFIAGLIAAVICWHAWH